MRIPEADRRIIALAVPALGALAAEPLYVLVDTGIVGQVGTLFARGERDAAAHLGRQAVLFAAALGVVLAAITAALAQPLLALLGGHGHVGRLALLYIRIAAIALPFALIAVASQGYFRGVARLKMPLLVLIGGNVLNAALELWFVDGLHWGIAGSAWGTVMLVLDAIAIAAQVLVSHQLALRDTESARALATRALDGILLGAGDTRYLALAMVPCSLLVFAPLAIASLLAGWGIVGIWLAIVALIAARFVFNGARFLSASWTQ